MKALTEIARAAMGIIQRDEWARRRWPRMTVGKIAGGLTERPLGLLSAFDVQGKPQWSRVYEPREMTELDEKRYKKLKAKIRALSRQMDKLKTGAYERGYPIMISRVVEITNEREGR